MNPGNGQPERLWQEYANAIFAGMAVSTLQYEETRQAFYAGMLACLNFVASTDLTSRPEEDSCRILDAFEANLIECCRPVSATLDKHRKRRR
jgi:hypothetical protein